MPCIGELVAQHSAATVGNVPTEVDSVLRKNYVYRIKLQSTQHILVALKDVCDVHEYRNGGVPTENCEQALKSQTFVNIRSVIAHPVIEVLANEV